MKLSLHEILKAERELAASRPAPKTQWERLLVPIDFTDSSREALKLAVTLAADPEDRITLLHVVEPASFMNGMDEVILAKTDQQVAAEFEDRLKQWASQEAGPDIEVEAVVRIGRIDHEIIRVAETRDCDVIVLATRPQNWFERTFLGSVTRRLQRKAPCAVITIRPPVPTPKEVLPVKFQPEEAWRAQHPGRRASAAIRR
jgi:nucleotide-binding universal stress UspA family protein